MIKPSYITHILSGLLIFYAIVVIIQNKNSDELKGIKFANLLLFLSTAIALHGMMHLWAEKFYGFNRYTKLDIF